MHLSFAEYTVTLSAWASEREMLDFLAQCKTGNVLINEGEEYSSKFYTATVYFNATENKFGIGLCSESHGLTPNLLLQPESRTLLFGFNSQVTGVRMPAGDIVFQLELPHYFYSFLSVNKQGLVLVVYETGLIAVTMEGKELWKYDGRDVITDWRVEGNHIYASFMSSASVDVDIDTGKPSR